MVTKREYLVEKGLAKAGHGRFSNAAKEAIKAAINKGIKFDEGEAAGSGVDATAEPRHDRREGMYVFQNPDGRKFERSHKTACVECGYSFQWCYCVGGPYIFAYLSGNDDYAKLLSGPKLARVQPEVSPRRGRGRKAA